MNDKLIILPRPVLVYPNKQTCKRYSVRNKEIDFGPIKSNTNMGEKKETNYYILTRALNNGFSFLLKGGF